VHSYFEWITMFWVIHFLFAMNVGVMVALRASLPNKRAAGRPLRREPAEPSQAFPAAA